MITDLANLGPSRIGTSDLGGSRAKDIGKAAQTGKPEKASSFDQILQNKVSAKPTENVLKSDKDVKANQLKKDPVPVQKGMEDMAPDKVPTQDRVEKSSGKDAPRTARKEMKNGDEPGSVKQEGQSEKVGEKTNSSSANRDQVMLEFMDSMESEFGIPPQRLVEAMTQIPSSDQLSSPEDSASQVIAQLNLPEDEEQKALAMYVGMLTQLKQPAMEPMAKAPFMAAAAVTAPALMSSQEKRALLNKSLDNMNNQFFLKTPQAATPDVTAGTEFTQMQSELPGKLGLEGLPQQDQVTLGKSIAPEKMPSMQNALQQNPALPQNAHQGMQAVDPKSPEGQQLLKSLATLSAAAAALDQDMKADPKTAQALKAEQALNGMGGAGTGAAAASAAGLAALGFGSDEEDGEMGGDSSPKDPFTVPQGHVTHADASRSELGETTKQSFGAMMAAASAEGKNPADNPANVQQLMKQAQYLIKKGGGEVKIQMAPEGIGQVHMKMVVNEGKVNLEMSAETKEAKKLIESSMSDLKASLGQHQLTIDKVKVDVGNQLTSDQQPSDQGQRQMDQGRDQAKDQTRQFWSEFSQNGGFDRRGSFFESPGVKAYGGTSRQGPALTPTSSGTMTENRYSGSGKGRGLNLVA